MLPVAAESRTSKAHAVVDARASSWRLAERYQAAGASALELADLQREYERAVNGQSAESIRAYARAVRAELALTFGPRVARQALLFALEIAARVALGLEVAQAPVQAQELMPPTPALQALTLSTLTSAPPATAAPATGAAA